MGGKTTSGDHSLNLQGKQVFLKSGYLALLALAFSLSLDRRPAVIFLVIALLSSFAFFDWRTWQKPGAWSLALFFLLHLIGMLYTTDTREGLFDIEQKLAFLLFPFLIPLIRSFSGGKKRGLIVSYFAGLLTAAICSWLIALGHFWDESYARLHLIELQDYPYTNYFFASRLSHFMHPGYFAAMLIFGLFLMHDYLRESKPPMQVVFLIVIIELFLFLTAVCLLSKASLLLLFLFFLMEAFRLDFLKRKKWKGVVLIAGVLFLFSLVLFLVPDIRQSFSQALYTWQHPEQINPNSASESSEMRMMTWKTAWNIFLQQPLTGTGTGDVNPELWKSFAEQGFLMPAEKHLNAHNQFLQTSAALGLPGLISLLLLPCYALLQGWREKNGHWLALGIMLLWLPMTECWFEQQQAMFFLLFWWVYLCGNNAESSQT